MPWHADPLALCHSSCTLAPSTTPVSPSSLFAPSCTSLLFPYIWFHQYAMSDPNHTPDRPQSRTTPFTTPVPTTPLPSSSIASAFTTPQQYRDRLAHFDTRHSRLSTPSEAPVHNPDTVEQRDAPLGTIQESENENLTNNTSSNQPSEPNNDYNNNTTESDVFEHQRREFDQRMLQMQNEKNVLQQQVQLMNQQLAQLQYQQALYQYHGDDQNNNSYNISKHISKPDSFNGDTKSDVDTWIAQMRHYLLLTGTPSNMQSHVASTYLKSTAAQWYNTLPVMERAQITNFETLAQSILNRFRPLDIVSQARRKLAKLHQTGSVESFNQAFMQLMSLIPTMNEEERINMYRYKLKFELQKQLVTQEYTSLSAIMNVALRTDSLLFEHNMIKPSNTRPQYRPNTFKHRTENNNATAAAAQLNNIKIDQPDASTEHEQDQPTGNINLNYVGIRPLDEAERQRCREQGLCFRCRKPGHRSAQCQGAPRPALKPSADISSKKY